MKRILVIGIGSLVMRDDGIGSRVAEAVANRLLEHDITVLVGETDSQYCFDKIKPDDLVIVVDAIISGRKPGSSHVMLLSDALNNRCQLRTQHEFSLFDLIELYNPLMQGYFIGIETADIGFGYALSAPLTECFEQICNDVIAKVIGISQMTLVPLQTAGIRE